MKIKAILASTLLTVLLAGTSVIAEDRDNLFEWELDAIPVETVEVKKVNYQAPVVSPDDESVLSGRK